MAKNLLSSPYRAINLNLDIINKGKRYEFEDNEEAEKVKEISEEIRPDPTERYDLLEKGNLRNTPDEQPYRIEDDEIVLNTHKPRYKDALETASKILKDEKYRTDQ